MTSSRREFLKRGTWIALAAGLPLSLGKKAFGQGFIASSEQTGLSRAAFESQLNREFLIHHNASEVNVRLVDVTNLGSREQEKAGKEGFSLIFRGSKDNALTQDTYLIENQELGMFSFLLVPMRTKDKRAQCYEAVVNRLYP